MMRILNLGVRFSDGRYVYRAIHVYWLSELIRKEFFEEDVPFIESWLESNAAEQRGDNGCYPYCYGLTVLDFKDKILYNKNEYTRFSYEEFDEHNKPYLLENDNLHFFPGGTRQGRVNFQATGFQYKEPKTFKDYKKLLAKNGFPINESEWDSYLESLK
jgi:hypothetical protein